MIRVGVLGITGYMGMELLRLLSGHPGVKVVSVTSRSYIGKKVREVLPHLDLELIISQEIAGEIDVLFSALPHGVSGRALLPFLHKGLKVIDLSADFRLKDPREYEQYYREVHPAPELLREAVYGLTEINAERISHAWLVANPGCYATAVILALAPLVKEGLIEEEIIVDAKSGISGAGRSLSQQTHFPEAEENLTAYALEGHRHTPEIVQELKNIVPDFNPSITFLPHLVPMSRGILASCYLKPRNPLSLSNLREVFTEFYKDKPFIRIVEPSPQTKWVRGSNFCFICPFIDRTGKVVVLSALDNLVKGGSGQAVQNMNLMFGLKENLGLTDLPLLP